MIDRDDEALCRLLDYNRRRYWLSNGWCIRFRVLEVPRTGGRPHGIKYSLTLHDTDMTRLLGIDNAHGLPRQQVFDHRHPFRSIWEMVPYDYTDADTLISDFFAYVEAACDAQGVEFGFDDDETELEHEDDEAIPE